MKLALTYVTLALTQAQNGEDDGLIQTHKHKQQVHVDDIIPVEMHEDIPVNMHIDKDIFHTEVQQIFNAKMAQFMKDTFPTAVEQVVDGMVAAGKLSRQGEAGEKGEAGQDGDHGRHGVNGADGSDGSDGSDGQDGQDGTDGKDGEVEKEFQDGWLANLDMACAGRNELGHMKGDAHQCKAACAANSRCIAVERNTGDGNCNLSTSCTKTHMSSHPRFNLYFKDKDAFEHIPDMTCVGRNDDSMHGSAAQCKAACAAHPGCIAVQHSSKNGACNLSNSCNKNRMTSAPGAELYVKFFA